MRKVKEPMFVTVLTEDPCIDVLFDYVSSTTEFIVYDEVKMVSLDSLLSRVIRVMTFQNKNKELSQFRTLALDEAMRWAYDIINTSMPFCSMDYYNETEDIKKEYDKSYNSEVIVIVNALIALYYLLTEHIDNDNVITSIMIEQPDILYVTCQ